jgi:hypothetical protein
MEGSHNRPPEETEDRKIQSPKNRMPIKEIAMNAIVATLYRDLTCAAAALLISVIVSASFVQSTATVVASDAAVTATATRSA